MEEEVMVSNRDIANLKQLRFKLVGAIKSSAISSEYKADIITGIEKIKMPLAVYADKSDIEVWSSFLGKVVARVDTILYDKGVHPLIIERVKDVIKKVKM